MKIAVVGGGISGLSAALILNSHYEVHLYEAESRLGGHAHTVSVDGGKESPVAVDTGFLVYNTLTYPHFTQFLDYLGVETAPSDMSLSIRTQDGLEWAGGDLKTVFSQKRNVIRPSFLRMLWDILDFNRNALKNLELSRAREWSLEDLIRSQHYSESFQRLYLLPMTGAIWSMSYARALQFPAETFLTFCLNHRLLQINDRPEWRTIKNGSINYVKRVRERLRHVHSSSPVTRLATRDNKVVITATGNEAEFDKVVLATHAPTSCELLKEHFPDLAAELSPLKVTSNTVLLHEDESVMPKNKDCWSAWNVNARNRVNDSHPIGLTYFINRLQPLLSNRRHFVTLNSNENLNRVSHRLTYDHPQFNFAAIKVQKHLPQLQGRHNLYFAGAWTRYGFHEDGILSAVHVASLLGAEPPWM